MLGRGVEGTAAVRKKDLREAMRALTGGLGRQRGTSKRLRRIHLLTVGADSFRIASIGETIFIVYGYEGDSCDGPY